MTNSRLITLNFSQPAGTPTDGIIQCVQHGRYLHVELEDTALMGYKVLGVAVDKETANEIGLTTKRRRPRVRAVSAGRAEGRPPAGPVAGGRVPVDRPAGTEVTGRASGRRAHRYRKKCSNSSRGVPSYVAHCRSPAYCWSLPVK